jgi:AcrR family transcriptional regulator
MRMEQRQITRSRLIDASIQIFAERGFFRATVDDIVETAGTTRSTFYLHFSSKADVLPEMLERSATHFRKMYDDLGTLVQNPSFAHVRRWLSNSMDEWSKVADLVAPLLAAAGVEPGVQEVLDRRGDKQSDELAKSLHDAIPTLDLDEGRIIARILMAPWGTYLDLHVRQVPFDREKVLDTLAEAWMAFLSSVKERHDHP